MTDDERISLRDDLDQLEDDETIVEDPDVRRAKTVLFTIAFGFLSLVVVVLALFFQPEGVVMTESWPNGYRKTSTTYVSATNEEGRIAHGPYRAWHQDGTLAARGDYEQGLRVGEWRFWAEDGALDEARSGRFVQGERVAPLEE